MICLLVFLLLVGGILLIFGIEGKQEGDEPRCRQCAYNLTALTSNRCPECGSVISERAVAWGLRRRNRPALIIAAVLLGLFAFGTVSLALGEFSSLNWYRYYPTKRLLRGASMNTRPHTAKLSRRLKNGLLGPAESEDVITFALSERASSTKKNPLPIWADVLAIFDGNRMLTKEQQEQFYAGLTPVAFSARPKVRLGEPIIVRLELIDHGAPPSPYLMFSVLQQNLWVDF